MKSISHIKLLIGYLEKSDATGMIFYLAQFGDKTWGK